MASQSKYQNAQLDKLLNELILTLEKQQAPVDLALMALGNTVTHILTHQIKSAEQRQYLADAFAGALKNSLKQA